MKCENLFIIISLMAIVYSCDNNVCKECTDAGLSLTDEYLSMEILYDSTSCPWSLIKSMDVPVQMFVNSPKLKHIVIKDQDSIQFVKNRLKNIENADTLSIVPFYERVNSWFHVLWFLNQATPLTFEYEYKRYSDTGFAVLLHSRKETSVIGIGCTPQEYNQYNNIVFRDSLLYFYVYDTIRQHDAGWRKLSDELYYDGEFMIIKKDELFFNE